MKPLNVFIGYDAREHDAYMVAKASIERRSSVPALITPLVADHLTHFLPPPIRRDGKLWDIESDAPMSTEFAKTRFCVKFLQKQGWALFMDCDMLCLNDIKKLFDLADDRYAVMCVKHDYQPKETEKMDGQVQTAYNRKNWSSVMLINCSHPGNFRLSKERLQRWPGRDLHAFRWLEDEEIGEIPPGWNHLIGVNDRNPDASLVHFTLGTPDLPSYQNCEYADRWHAEQR